MNVDFVKTALPCVCNAVTLWHAQHGWIWDVCHRGVPLGVFYCTLLCGEGVVIHFSTLPDVIIPAGVILAAFRKALKITSPLGVVFATIPEEQAKLIRVVKRLGFVETGGNFPRPGDGEIVLLKYLPCPNDIL